MKLIYAGMTSAVVAAGLVGSVAAYRSQTEPVSKAVSVQHAKPEAVVQWAPCKEPSKLEDGVCITDVVRTVMRPAPPVSAPAAPSYSAVTTPSYAARYGTTSPVGVREGDDDAYEDREDGEDREDRDVQSDDDESEDVQAEDSEDHADEDHGDESGSEQRDGEDQEGEH